MTEPRQGRLAGDDGQHCIPSSPREPVGLSTRHSNMTTADGRRGGGTRMVGLRRAVAGLGCAGAVLVLLVGCGSLARTGTTPARAEKANRSDSGSAQHCPYATWLASSTASPAPTSTSATSNTPQADELAQALGTQSRRPAYANVYSTLIVDYPRGRVALCVTDLAQGRLMAAAAKTADPKIDLSRIDYYLSRYGKAFLDGAADRLADRLASRLGTTGTLAGVPIYGVGPAQDYDKIQITTSAAGVTSAALRAELTRLLDGLPFTLVPGAPAVASGGTAAGR